MLLNKREMGSESVVEFCLMITVGVVFILLFLFLSELIRIFTSYGVLGAKKIEFRVGGGRYFLNALLLTAGSASLSF